MTYAVILLKPLFYNHLPVRVTVTSCCVIPLLRYFTLVDGLEFQLINRLAQTNILGSKLEQMSGGLVTAEK